MNDIITVAVVAVTPIAALAAYHYGKAAIVSFYHRVTR